MRPYDGLRHPPDGFGFLHGGPGFLELIPLALLALLALGLLAALLVLAGRALFGRGRAQAQNRAQTQAQTQAQTPARPAANVSAVELLRQRYARGEIDGDTFQVMLGQLRASEAATGSGGAAEGGQWQSV